MKRLTMLLALVLSAGLLASAALAEEVAEPKKPEKKKREGKPEGKAKATGLRGAYAIMAKVCDLSEDQQKQMADLSGQRDAALKAFDEANKDKLAAAKEASKKAADSKDKEEMKKAKELTAPLTAERNKLQEEWTAKIMGVLKAEQKVKWDQYNFTNMVLGRFGKAKLTEDQNTKAKALITENLKGVDLGDEKAKRAAAEKIAGLITEQILTPEQKETMPKAKAPAQPREKKPAAGKKPKDKPAEGAAPAGEE